MDQFKTTTESHYERYRNLLNPLVNHLETTRTTNRNAVMELAKTKVPQLGITDSYANVSSQLKDARAQLTELNALSDIYAPRDVKTDQELQAAHDQLRVDFDALKLEQVNADTDYDNLKRDYETLNNKVSAKDSQIAEFASKFRNLELEKQKLRDSNTLFETQLANLNRKVEADQRAAALAASAPSRTTVETSTEVVSDSTGLNPTLNATAPEATVAAAAAAAAARTAALAPQAGIAIVDKPKRLDPKIPKFSGLQSENVNKWLYQINSCFLYNNISDDRKMLSIISHLDGTALNLHRSMTESKRLANQVCSWSEFETALSSMFRPVDYIDNIRCQLRSLKHTQNTAL